MLKMTIFSYLIDLTTSVTGVTDNEKMESVRLEYQSVRFLYKTSDACLLPRYVYSSPYLLSKARADSFLKARH